ncbi:hypothetical protein QA635_22545 [Bradyrhizobium brasilense]|uniref:hypothetical protein n=1 Tax=Bradyrhizobium brasilense TaxID=1419277 RepID=UPI0024B15A46|nr:hypothetical protein [Bradyrhizobium australafricanum]WFU29395.1 hypothetical protein QA635_22545 [Bradyrhizobium australafricanum]
MYGTAKANRSFPGWSIRANVPLAWAAWIASNALACSIKCRAALPAPQAGQQLGIKEVDDGIWLVSFMHDDLGYFDLEQKTLQPLDNPFGTRLSPMS